MMAVDDWVAVVDKAIQMVGEDQVALGTDFDGGPTLARGMRNVRDLPMTTDAMLRRGTQKSASTSSGEATVAFLPASRSTAHLNRSGPLAFIGIGLMPYSPLEIDADIVHAEGFPTWQLKLCRLATFDSTG